MQDPTAITNRRARGKGKLRAAVTWTEKVSGCKRLDKHYYQLCLVPGFQLLPQKKHLSYKYPQITGNRRKHLLAVAG